jgi:polysaccharide biosynthesis/export protein
VANLGPYRSVLRFSDQQHGGLILLISMEAFMPVSKRMTRGCIPALLLLTAVTITSIALAQAPVPLGDPSANQNARKSRTPTASAPGRINSTMTGKPAAVQPVPPLENPAGSVGGATTQTVTTGMSAAPDLRISSGDLLEISVYGAPDFDRVPARVSGAGEILLPMIGSVKVDGLTAEEVAKTLHQKLSDGAFYNDPQVTVFVREYATQGVSVLGEVQKPGVYPILGQRKLFDAISIAGGLTPRAGRFVTVTHKGDPKPVTVRLENDAETSAANNVEIRPGDTIAVSKAGIVYVVGDVRMPGGFIMDNGTMSVLQALAMAQGANGTAKLDDAKLIRKSGQGQQETPIALKKILSSKAPDMALQPDDILFVPNSASKSIARRSLEAIVQTATGVAIYRH